MSETFFNIRYTIFGDIMYVINQNVTQEFIIKNSRFITLLFKIQKSEDVQEILNNIRIKYPKATHYCYAYITPIDQKSSDDKEPSGTAGIPMLNVLKKEKITNVLAVVIRYFGGIKLGAGGLVRAYSKGVTEALSNIKKIPLVKGIQLEIKFEYKKQKEIEYLLRDSTILEKEFQDLITYKALVTSTLYYKILENKNYQILSKKNIDIEDITYY